MPVTTKFQSAGLSDTGRKRTNNEDRFHCDTDRGIFFVVDGMGGQAAGEKAADTAVQVMQARLERQTGTNAERLREAITLANNEIFHLGTQNPEWQGMACVLTAALVEDDRATLGHVGDSRAYLLEPGGIRKVTSDHSPVGEREDAGELTERQAMDHPRRNEVFRDVGSTEHNPEDPNYIELLTIPFAPENALLLCSDGLSDLLASSEIRSIVEEHAGNPRMAVQKLIDAANQAGGKDNVTAVLVEHVRYASAVQSQSDRTREAAPAEIGSGGFPWYLSRWAFLLYGALLVLLAYAAVHISSADKKIVDVSTPPSGPKVLIVGKGANATSTTISDALDRAQLGDTVMVMPGHYIEQLQLREGVNVISQKAQGAVLQSSLGDVAVVANDLKSGRLSGFRIGGDAQHRLAVGLALKNTNIEVDDIEITGTGTAAVEIRGTSAPMLHGNHILQNAGTGIAIYDSATPRLLHNVIEGNGSAEPMKRPGLEIHDGATPVLIGNTIIGNKGGAVWMTRQAVTTVPLDQNFFGAVKRGAAKSEIRVIPQ